ncbi:enoyl-CoA hydratase/isomerase family protein [Thermodesulfobacteriota bacterium]
MEGWSRESRKRLALEVIEAIESCPKAIIARVHGYCLTGALEIATSCDMIVASENARFGDTHARWGLTPTWGGSQRLPRMVGPMKAKELVFVCDMISGRDAERIGLVNRAVPEDGLDETIEEITGKILANSRLSIAIQKSLINRGLRMDYQSALELAEAESPGATEDAERRIEAFLQKSWDKEAAKK